MNPDWNDLKVVLALEKAGSVAGASRRLGVNGSTVSRRLAALEEALGATLLVRGGREFRWTADGETVIGAARRFEALWAETCRELSASGSAVEGTVRLSTVASVMTRLMPAQMRLRERYPALRLELIGEDTTADLASGDVDIALRMFRPSEAGLVCRRVMDLIWHLYASRDYVERCGTPPTIDALAGHYQLRYITTRHGVPGMRWMDDHGDGTTAYSRFNNPDALATALVAGLGVGTVPSLVAERHANLVKLFPEPVVRQPAYLVYHESLRDSARIRAVVDAFVGTLASEGEGAAPQGSDLRRDAAPRTQPRSGSVRATLRQRRSSSVLPTPATPAEGRR